ncbi:MULTISPECIES: LCP family protein [unclassified Corynebacterium]|uniref:LCP family protein n=1 Tax=unclassified Corynebacterium TaxID=2624378 RepID=UPI002166C7FE|nr:MULTISPECIES: LCP family protein [unclassified Corynebacterium]MCS4489496.1 LCP family protein [Corynebacterium sp. ES2775-CONJ]MCS4531407.1 LCP family protein [Corynebacterium sp. ES2730-CONJ]
MSTTPKRPVRDISPAPHYLPQTAQQGPGVVKVLLAFISAAVLTISGVGYATVGRVGNSVASAGSLELGGDQGVKEEKLDGAIDILLVGSDSRTDAQGNPLTPEEIELLHAGDEEADNTDTIMLIRIPNDGTSATAISIPRDTYIADPELGNIKINGVYAGYKAIKRTELFNAGIVDEQELESQSKQAGRNGLIDAVTNLAGVTIDHYAEIGLLGFVLLTDAVGGVDVCLNNAVYDEFSGADFPAGVQTLSGGSGLAFVRQRHGLPRGDLDRIVRQQAYMASLVNKVLSTGTLTSPGKLAQLGQAVTRSVVIDEDWDVISFATQLQDLAGGNVRFNTIPVADIDGVGDYGESVVTIDPDEVKAFFQALLGTDEEPADPADAPAADEGPAEKDPTPIQVLNASAQSGLAAGAGAYLTEQGFTIADVGNAEIGRYDRTQVITRNLNDSTARKIAKALGGVPVVEDPELAYEGIVVIAGGDYSAPIGEPGAPVNSNTAEPESNDPGSVVNDAADSPQIDAGGDSPRCVN